MTDFLSNEQSWASLNILVVSPTPTHPQDHGNRKRIYEVCAELKRRGARVEFVYYPGEHDWRDTWPERRESEMRAEWDAFHLVPPSRGLHESAIGQDHGIDEWADPSLSAFISWACRVRAYDVVVVNYTWMSFCLDAVPKEIFKICDTHDVFGGRRQVLESNGIKAEFFHTTSQEEARGLARANLVWAIKPEEQTYFQDQLGLPNCLTMLHAEPERDWWRKPPSIDGWLRAGVIGAKNSINKENLEAFLADALPVFETYMAPVKLVVAGGLSDFFQTWTHPNVEVIGRVDEVEEFYRQVDVVIAPIKFSTGLKIKVAEALASGAPLVAHAHAMEGYPTKEPLHLLHSFREVAVELAKLSFDRQPLMPLARRSGTVCQTIRKSVSASLDETLRQIVSSFASTTCVIVPAEAFDPSNLLHDHLLEALDYLRFCSPLAIFAEGHAPKRMNFDFLQRYDLRRQIFVDPALAAAAGEQRPDFWVSISLTNLLNVRGYERLYLMTECADDIMLSKVALQLVIVRCDAVEIGGGDANGLIETLRHRSDLTLVSCEPEHFGRWQGAAGISQLICAPFRRNGTFGSLERRSKGRQPGPLLVLARPDDPVADELLRLARRLGWEGARVDPSDPATRQAMIGREAGTDPLARFADVRLLVDMTEDEPLADVIGEAAIRLGTPRLRLMRGQLALGLHNFATPQAPTSLARLFSTVAECIMTSDKLESMREMAKCEAQTRYAKDAGWTVLWGLMKAAQRTGKFD